MNVENISMFNKISDKIRELKEINKDISPNDVHNKLIEVNYIDPYSDNPYPITFEEAVRLDNIYFNLGGSYWRKDFSFWDTNDEPNNADDAVNANESDVHDENSHIIYYPANGYTYMVWDDINLENSKHFQVYNCGIFTCDIKLISD